jgi:hypothetical protein
MSVAVWSFLKGLYGVGFTLVSRSYYFLRRRSPAPPVPARDHRQAGERGGYKCRPALVSFGDRSCIICSLHIDLIGRQRSAAGSPLGSLLGSWVHVWVQVEDKCGRCSSSTSGLREVAG